jgi:hypothetical protein
VALSAQVTVINRGAQRERCGIVLEPGENIVLTETLELMADLGYLDESKSLGISYDLSGVVAASHGDLVLTLEAAATVETP